MIGSKGKKKCKKLKILVAFKKKIKQKKYLCAFWIPIKKEKLRIMYKHLDLFLNYTHERKIEKRNKNKERLMSTQTRKQVYGQQRKIDWIEIVKVRSCKTKEITFAKINRRSTLSGSKPKQ